MDGKIDIHNVEIAYERALQRLRESKEIIPENKEMVIRFLWDCKVGKTITGKAKKRIGAHRRLKYLYSLKQLSAWLGKPFANATSEDMEILVSNLEDDVFRKINGQPYGEETKLDFKKTLRKFYNWLGKLHLVEFMDMSFQRKDAPVITREQVEQLINSTPSLKLKAAIMVLFDGGARSEEFLNIRLKDVSLKKHNGNHIYWINIRISKTDPRTIPLPLCTKQLAVWLEEHPDKNNPEAQLFPYCYTGLKERIRKLALIVLKTRVTPHILRHSSATYWASKMNRYVFCAKYGWDFSSKMPDRYIKRKGIIFDHIAEQGDTEQKSKLEHENQALRDKLNDFQEQYDRLSQDLDLILPIIADDMDGFKTKLLQQRIAQLRRGGGNQRLKGHLRIW